MPLQAGLRKRLLQELLTANPESHPIFAMFGADSIAAETECSGKLALHRPSGISWRQRYFGVAGETS